MRKVTLKNLQTWQELLNKQEQFVSNAKQSLEHQLRSLRQIQYEYDKLKNQFNYENGIS
jgi:DNA-binding protein H-NS